MDRNQAKKILKIVAVIYLASFLIVNWSDVSWVFNYRTVSGLVSDFFNPYPSIDASSMKPYFYPNHSEDKGSQNVKEFKTRYTNKQNVLEIPKLSLEVPIVFSASTDTNVISKDLDSGVVFYPGSVYPGQQGQTVILGHSAPPGWPKVRHDWVFSDLEKLNVGDSILVNLNNKQYTFIVREKSIVKRGADVPISNLTDGSNVLILISCWPPGKDYQRITVSAELADSI
ncbi:MAG: class E sortase [bacterium]